MSFLLNLFIQNELCSDVMNISLNITIYYWIIITVGLTCMEYLNVVAGGALNRLLLNLFY